MSAQKQFQDGLQSIPSIAPAAYCVRSGNTELIPGQSPILGDLPGLGTRNTLALTKLLQPRITGPAGSCRGHHAGRKPGLAIQRLGSRLHKFQEGLESPVGL